MPNSAVHLPIRPNCAVKMFKMCGEKRKMCGGSGAAKNANCAAKVWPTTQVL